MVDGADDGQFEEVFSADADGPVELKSYIRLERQYAVLCVLGRGALYRISLQRHRICAGSNSRAMRIRR